MLRWAAKQPQIKLFPTSAYHFIHGWCGIISCWACGPIHGSSCPGATQHRAVLQKQALAGTVGRPRIASRRRRCRWKMGVSKWVDSCHKHDHMGQHETCTRYLCCLLKFSMSPNNLYLSVGGCQDGWVPFYCGNACFITSMLSIQPFLNLAVFITPVFLDVLLDVFRCSPAAFTPQNTGEIPQKYNMEGSF